MTYKIQFHCIWFFKSITRYDRGRGSNNFTNNLKTSLFWKAALTLNADPRIDARCQYNAGRQDNVHICSEELELERDKILTHFLDNGIKFYIFNVTYIKNLYVAKCLTCKHLVLMQTEQR